jgi:MYXO-CTERM domain-containing protein
VSLGGVSQGSFTNPSATTTLQWQEFSIDFTPTSTSQNIAFFNGNASNNFAGGLDNVTLDLADNPVPSPSVPGPLPLLGVGAAFGWSRRLRKRIAAPLSTPPQA